MAGGQDLEGDCGRSPRVNVLTDILVPHGLWPTGLPAKSHQQVSSKGTLLAWRPVVGN